MNRRSSTLGKTVRLYDRLFDRPFPYMMLLYAAPKGEEKYFQFHIQFLPFLDTQDLSFEHIPLPTNYQFAVIHSGKTRALVESGYKKRRKECEAAAAFLHVSSLRDVYLPDLERAKDMLDPLRKRAMHVVTENQRVLNSVAALKNNRIADFGKLMNASHLSQKNQFEVTIKETDSLWEAAIKYGAIGARQTGGGFGGAIVALVPTHAVQSWWNFLSKACPKASLICMS